MSVLDEILASTRAELARRTERLAPARLAEMAATARVGRERGRLVAALRRPGVGVIAEIKRRSPSAGMLRADPEIDVAAIAASYEAAGAAAISVLTDGPHFGGSLADIEAARGACGLPILRKDFIVDEYQLNEAVLAGAEAILLIVAALSEAELAGLHAAAGRLGLDALVEVHDERELERALSVGARLIGINNRDLRDFTVEVERTFELLGHVPLEEVTLVSESGIGSPDQVRRLGEAGVHAVLIGGSLMAAEHPGEALRALRASFMPADDLL